MSKLLIIYWSSTGNTEVMARRIEDGAKEVILDVKLLEVTNANSNMIDEYTHIALGCSAMGAEVLSDEMEEFFEEIKEKLEGKKVALFGSYGWGDGEWMRNWEEALKVTKAELFNSKGLIINESPTKEDEEKLKEYGKELVNFN